MFPSFLNSGVYLLQIYLTNFCTQLNASIGIPKKVNIPGCNNWKKNTLFWSIHFTYNAFYSVYTRYRLQLLEIGHWLFSEGVIFWFSLSFLEVERKEKSVKINTTEDMEPKSYSTIFLNCGKKLCNY